jgi:hypothetical protein
MLFGLLLIKLLKVKDLEDWRLHSGKTSPDRPKKPKLQRPTALVESIRPSLWRIPGKPGYKCAEWWTIWSK